MPDLERTRSTQASGGALLPAVARDTSVSVLLPAAVIPGDEYWSADFGRRGIYGTVIAACAVGTDLYVGGSFYWAGSKRCNNVARWGGSEWQPLGTGVWLDGGGTQVAKMLEFEGNLIVVGLFDYAGGIPLPGVMAASWDGQAWHAMSGNEWSGAPYDLIANGQELLASGSFWSDTQQRPAGLLRWTGTDWEAAGQLTSAGALGVHNGLAYAGEHTSLVTWDGTTSRAEPESVGCSHPADSGPRIGALLSDGERLIVGGQFECASPPPNGIGMNNVGAWNGSAWDALGNGLFDADWEYEESAPMVWSLGLFNGELFAGGDFLSAEGRPSGVRHIGRWNGSSWNPVGGGCSNNVYVLTPYGNKLVAGGWMGYAGDQDVWGIAAWDGNAWAGFGSPGGGVNNPVCAFTIWNDLLIAAGLFDRAGSTSANGIAAWDGSSWQPLGAGLQGLGAYLDIPALGVLGLGTYQGTLIVAGKLTGAGGLSALHVAQWDGSEWHAMGEGLPEQERAVCEYRGQLYVGKYRWTGTSWEKWLLAGGGYDGGQIYCMRVWNDLLVAGGWFLTVDGQAFSRIVSYDGTDFRPLGAGFPNGVFGPLSMAEYEGDLLVGGSLGSEYRACLARWDGTDWHGLVGGLNTVVDAILVQGSHVFAGGLFTSIESGEVPANHVAYFDGATWHPMGNGCSGAYYYRRRASALALYQGSLYVGGDFTIAGNSLSWFIAKWRDPSVPVYLKRLGAERSGATVVVRAEFGEALANERIEVWRALPGHERDRIGEAPATPVTSFTYTDASPPSGGADYWLRVTQGSGEAMWFGPAQVDAAPVPERLTLSPAQPNPFNPRTTIHFGLPSSGRVRLTLHDMQGHLVRGLIDEIRPAGEWTTEWDGLDQQGRPVGSGTYLLRLVSADGTRGRKLTLAR